MVDALVLHADEGRMLCCEMADQTQCSHYESTMSEWGNPSSVSWIFMQPLAAFMGTRRTETSKYPEEKIP